MTQDIYPCIWFDGNAKQAAEFYCTVFENATISEENPMVVIFNLNGHKFMGLNGGPMFKPTEAVSFVVSCDTQVEIDKYWEKLTADGGEESRCGWLKDKFGISWQIVPSMLGKIMSDPQHGQQAMQALMNMRKLDIAALENA